MIPGILVECCSWVSPSPPTLSGELLQSLFPPQGEVEWAGVRLVEVAAATQATAMSIVPSPNSTAGSTGTDFLLCDSDLKGDRLARDVFRSWPGMGPGAGLWGEGRRKTIAPCLHLSSPSHSVNQPLQDREDLGTEWSPGKQDGSLCGHHLSHIGVQDKCHSSTQHGSKERLYWEEGNLLGWVTKGREGRRRLLSSRPTERSRGQGLCGVCGVVYLPHQGTAP